MYDLEEGTEIFTVVLAFDGLGPRFGEIIDQGSARFDEDGVIRDGLLRYGAYHNAVIAEAAGRGLAVYAMEYLDKTDLTGKHLMETKSGSREYQIVGTSRYVYPLDAI